MPTLGADMTVGTLLSWMKKPGDQVKRGEIIADVDTDKGVIEVEVFTSGIIEKLLDIDSMDFLNFVIALDEELDVGIPETEYPKLATLDSCVKLITQAKAVIGVRQSV